MLSRACESLKHRNSSYHEENQYLNLLDDILSTNSEFVGRNGKTLSIYGSAMRFSLENNSIPLITTKKVAWKTCLRELLWFIKGSTNNKLLKEQNVHIWDANGSREFLDSRGLQNNNEDDLGPIYGFQWRHFNADYVSCDTDYSNKGIDQLKEVINTLKDPLLRNSRRMIISAWNPSQLNSMALPPCHIMMQFNVTNNNKLSCSMYQRSNDEACGTCFNIASYSFLTHLLAIHCGLEPYEFIYYKGNCHIYQEHISNIKIQLQRQPYEFPSLHILNKRENIEDYNIDDFKVSNYKYHSPLEYKMVA
jgi:thymidylate synthase|uniref:thymidylate synthase n=1 Tax=viral metagenome TaxID=1070528 RepID=A0A6C0CDY8_9ZZZZ